MWTREPSSEVPRDDTTTAVVVVGAETEPVVGIGVPEKHVFGRTVRAVSVGFLSGYSRAFFADRIIL